VRINQRFDCWIVASFWAGGLQCAGGDTRVRWPARVRSGEVRAVGQLCCRANLPVQPLSGRARPARHRQAGATFLRAGLRCEDLSHAEIRLAAALSSPKIMSRHEMGRSSLRRWMRHQGRTMSSTTPAHRSRPEPSTVPWPRQAMPGEAVLKVWSVLSFEKLCHQTHNDTITKLEHKCGPDKWLFITGTAHKCRPCQ